MRALLLKGLYAYMCTARASFGGKQRISSWIGGPLARHFFGSLSSWILVRSIKAYLVLQMGTIKSSPDTHSSARQYGVLP
jgi:hypothetical protein